MTQILIIGSVHKCVFILWCTILFTYSRFHKLTHMHTYSLNLWINLFYAGRRFTDITARQTFNHLLISFTFMHLPILLFKRYTWELNPWLWHCWCWCHESKYISTRTNTEKAMWITRCKCRNSEKLMGCILSICRFHHVHPLEAIQSEQYDLRNQSENSIRGWKEDD